MQVRFDSLYYQNFLSTGSGGIKIDLAVASKTLSIGKNGEGKSTFIDALTFVLFGKPFRNINKPQLVNSINKKACLVTIEFTIGTKSYLVKRGIKPNVFEIYENGTLLNEAADMKDYQKVLETQILKMNYKTFTQVVVLGSSSYTPFMKLAAAQRREVIEDILDIKIFSIMNKILKDRISDSKQVVNEYENKLIVLRDKVASQKKLIQTLSESKDAALQAIKENIATNESIIAENQEIVSKLLSDIEQLQANSVDISDVQNKIDIAKTTITKKETKISSQEKDIEFFNVNDSCTVCQQEIDPKHKHTIVSNLEKEVKKAKVDIEMYKAALIKLKAKVDTEAELQSKIQNANKEIYSKNNSTKVLQEQIEKYKAELAEAVDDSDKIDLEKEELTKIIVAGKELATKKATVDAERTIQDICIQLLKDTAVKAAIVKEYLPVINRLINKHLNDMDFYASFELNENFEEVIKSRNRDEFSYASFSEGEKFRIDLAIMFTWREIAKMKNSLNTNLLVFDEILDGVVDGAGVSFFLEYIGELQNTNTFVISHNDKAQEHFDRILSFKKQGDFSVMTEQH